MNSIVVLTYNRDVLPCLKAIKENTIGEHEVILVDNGTKNKCKDFQIRGLVDKYIRIKNEGVLARNYGRLIAKGDYVLNVDDDVIVHPGWDETLIDFIETHHSIVASGQMGFLAYPDMSNFNRVPRRQGELCDFITGFCWAYKNKGNDMIPSDWFTPSGGPSALHDETWVQCLMRERGGKFIVSPIVCTHNSQRSNVNFSDDADKIQWIQKRFDIRDLHLERV
jgi:glycosyltransferase involved in cell wall biosynthesis